MNEKPVKARVFQKRTRATFDKKGGFERVFQPSRKPVVTTEKRTVIVICERTCGYRKRRVVSRKESSNPL